MSEENENWYDHLPETVQGTQLVQNSRDLDHFHERLSEYDSYQGQSIRIPSDDAGDDVRSAFNQKLLDRVPNLMQTPDSSDDEAYRGTLSKLGMPAEAKDYAIPEYEDFEFSDEQAEQVKAIAHDMGMTRKQFDKYIDGVAEEAMNSAASQQGYAAEQSEALKEAWGSATDERIAQVKEFAKLSGAPDSLLQALDSNSARAEEMQWLYTMSQGIGGEGSQLAQQDSDKPKTTGNLDPAEAELQIQEILGNKEHPYHNPLNSAHKAAQAKFFKLVEMTESGKKAII